MSELADATISPAIREVFALLHRVRDARAAVLITGESGTGKERIAKRLHALSKRANGPFVAINCAAMPEALLESELFGHARGAFTDAKSSRSGLFVKAHGGTLFLDEIGELPIGLQPKLLRALQERTVRPVGADTEIPFDARLVAATNADLETAVQARQFREDLYYRINVVHIELPALRDRGTDALLLAREFLARACEDAGVPTRSISAPVAHRLLAYPWPGNVRELQNCMERAVALSTHGELVLEDLPEKIRSVRPKAAVLRDNPDTLRTMQEVEKEHIQRVLAAVDGRKAEAARILGFDRTTLYRKLARHQLE